MLAIAPTTANQLDRQSQVLSGQGSAGISMSLPVVVVAAALAVWQAISASLISLFESALVSLFKSDQTDLKRSHGDRPIA